MLFDGKDIKINTKSLFSSSYVYLSVSGCEGCLSNIIIIIFIFNGSVNFDNEFSVVHPTELADLLQEIAINSPPFDAILLWKGTFEKLYKIYIKDNMVTVEMSLIIVVYSLWADLGLCNS